MNVELYAEARSNGCSPKLAEMLASKRAPGLVTDTLTFAGTAVGDPFANVHEDHKPYYYAKARAAGVNPSGKRYLASLARSPGDPEALVDSRGDVRRRLEERGWGADGMVKVKAREPDRDPESVGAPADDIVTDRAREMLAKDGCDGTCTVREWEATKEKAKSTLDRRNV